jgi:ACS family sodium-dependent inorganic phosphate cotransporter
LRCDRKAGGRQLTDANPAERQAGAAGRREGAAAAAEAPLPPALDAGAAAPTTRDGSNAAAAPSLGALDVAGRWQALPARYKVVAATSLAFVICNMDKVNISVAIIPMAEEFGWSPTTAGLVQSSFFCGYLLSQLPGGLASSLLGGRRVLPAGVAMWSAATAGVPFLASTIPGLFLSRAAVGLGEGVAPSAATDIVARIIDTAERSRAISFIFGGLHVGSLLGLAVAPVVIEQLGWPVVFYLFGGLGLAWSAWWQRLIASLELTDPEVAAALALMGDTDDEEEEQEGAGSDAESAAAAAAGGGHGGAIPRNVAAVPWRSFLRSPPVRALAYTHFCNNWFHYTMLAWLPTYMMDTLDLSLMGAAQVSVLPPIAAIAVSAVAGPLADGLIARGVAVGNVRKLAQSAAFVGPAACLGAAAAAGDGDVAVALITLSLGLASFSLAGLYCNHADLSPRYAPVLLGVTNTSGALPGIVGVAATGALYDATGSWTLALFAPSVFFFLTGTAVYVRWGSAERQDFGANNQPFAIEALWSGGGGGEGQG